MLHFGLNAERLALALRLQAVDRKIAEPRSGDRNPSKHVTEIEKKLGSAHSQLRKDRAALTANGRDRRQLDGDIQTHQQKISKLRDQSLQAKTNSNTAPFKTKSATPKGKSEERKTAAGF